MIDRKFQVFISSTYRDLKDERDEVIKAILKDYNFPVGMEMFHADDNEQWVQIARTIDTSDYYILIMGHYCGTVIKKEKRSYTEKEYDYALAKGIPVLAFVIDEDVPVKLLDETAEQKRIYKKFRKKVEKLPRETWRNKEDLAHKISSTLNLKIKENKRNGWVQFDPYGMYGNTKIPENIAGKYTVVYLSAKESTNDKLIFSTINIAKNGDVDFKNNIKTQTDSEAEFMYHGKCVLEDKVLNIRMKNDFSDERLNMELISSVGNLKRQMGLLLGLSPDGAPACVKVAFFKNDILDKINWDVIKKLLKKENTHFNKNSLIVDSSETAVLFSDEIFK